MNEVTSTILLVEDNEEDVFALKRALRKANIANRLQTLDNARDATDYLAGKDRFADRSQYPLPFLVFLDLKLSSSNGFEILAWIQQQPALAEVAVVVLSGSEDASDQQKAYVLGARSYLVKPPIPEDLRRLMKSLKIFWSRFDEDVLTG